MDECGRIYVLKWTVQTGIYAKIFIGIRSAQFYATNVSWHKISSKLESANWTVMIECGRPYMKLGGPKLRPMPNNLLA